MNLTLHYTDEPIQIMEVHDSIHLDHFFYILLITKINFRVFTQFKINKCPYTSARFVLLFT